MNRNQLISEIRKKKSFLCVGLDSDLDRIPKHLLELEDPIFEFNKQIIDATKDLCVAYKPNIAFYEAQGESGWSSLRKTRAYIPENTFTIADAKRGDIGNTCNQYAKAFFNDLGFDSLTIAPYMGKDSVTPFLEYENKWAIILALTSNPGSADFQMKKFVTDDLLFEEVLQETSKWGNTENTMYVVGATQAEYLRMVRRWVPEHFLLVPGVGSQGGSLKEVAENGMTKDVGLLVNSSRSIIYASDGEDFAEAARAKAKELQSEMSMLL